MNYTRLLLCALVGFLCIWQCSASAASEFTLFSNGVAHGLSLVTNQPDRIKCEVANNKGINGGKAIVAYTNTYALEHDNCYFKLNSAQFNVNDYTELEFFAKVAQPTNPYGFAGIFLKDKEGDFDGPYANIPQTFKRFRFPIKNTFSDINLGKIISPFYLELFLKKGEAIYADNVVLRNRPYFDIFSDATTNGREELISWGEGLCFVKSDDDAPDGEDVLSIPPKTWGCGLFYFTPPLDLSYFRQIQFQLKSKVDVLIEIEDANNKKKGITVKSTNDQWKEITLNLSQFDSVNFNKIKGAILITKIDDASSEVQVDQIRYLPKN